MDTPPSHAGLEYILARIIQDFMQFMHQTGLSTPQIHALMYIYHRGRLPALGNWRSHRFEQAGRQPIGGAVGAAGIGGAHGRPAGQAQQEIATHR